MPRHLAAVDAICCLRNPVLEGASASLILAMRTGRPVLVSDHGPYAEIPDGLVLKCRPGHEATDVRLHLEALLADPAPARAMAQRARAYAKATFTASGYVDRLLPISIASLRACPPCAPRWVSDGRSPASAWRRTIRRPSASPRRWTTCLTDGVA